MTTLNDFYLGARYSVTLWETLEVSHPSFSQAYRVVANNTAGISAAPAEGEARVDFEYYPIQFSPSRTQDDLDYAIQVVFADLGQVLPTELERVANAGTFEIKPRAIYRGYRSDNLDVPIIGPLNLEVLNMTYTQQGAAFTAQAPSVNILKTGEIYTLERFPTLRGFL